jgi:hypothetical protein
MANVKKMTKRDYFNQLLAIAEVKANAELEKFINHELDLLTRKNASTSGKLNADQKKNEELKAQILDCMGAEPNRMFTITEMIKEFECCANYSLPKISALVRQLKESGQVIRLEEKRKAYFKIA